MAGVENGPESQPASQPTCVVIGGGLAGLSCAAALGEAGFTVRLLEARPFAGGRATSYHLPESSGITESIDNCQHVLLRCCVNLMDFYRRLGTASRIRFHDEFHFLEPGGRMSTLRSGPLPAPLHFAGSFLGLKFLNTSEKLAIGRALLALRREWRLRQDLDRITMLEWLREKGQPGRAIERFWRQVLVSAVNEELGRMAARHGFQVMRLGFLAGRGNSQMGIPAIPLGELYAARAWERFSEVEIRLRAPAHRLVVDDGSVRGAETADEVVDGEFFVSCVPFEKLPGLIPELELDFEGWSHSPITGIHLWFDRPVTHLPHGTLLDRTIQWFFNKGEGKHLQLVVSASRSLLPMDRAAVIELGLSELKEFLPEAGAAKLVKAHVVKEVRATFAARPGLESLRPLTETRIKNLFLAGDWTRTGWPATMEGAVRSGYRAAEAVSRAAGAPRRFVLPDVA